MPTLKWFTVQTVVYPEAAEAFALALTRDNVMLDCLNSEVTQSSYPFMVHASNMRCKTF